MISQRYFFGLAATRPTNQHLLASIAAAHDVAQDLVERGYDLLECRLGPRNPRITIAPCHRCRDLGGAIRIIKGGPEGRKYTMVALHRGVQIDWEERA